MSDPIRTLVEMARAAQHDDRQSTGALYGKLAKRIEALEAALREIAELKIKVHSSGVPQEIARAALVNNSEIPTGDVFD